MSEKDSDSGKSIHVSSIVLLLVVVLGLALLYVYVLDTGDIAPPRIDRECCEAFCDMGGYDCHRYTSEYIMCKSYDLGGHQLVLDFWVNDTKRVCENAKNLSNATA